MPREPFHFGEKTNQPGALRVAVVVIDMQAAKAYLNKQSHNPVFGNLPTSVMVVN